MNVNKLFEYITLRGICLDLEEQINRQECSNSDPDLIIHLKESLGNSLKDARNLEQEMDLPPLVLESI